MALQEQKKGFLVSDLKVKREQNAVGLEHDLSRLVAVANLQSCVDFVKICQPVSAKRDSQSVVHRCSAGSRICIGTISMTVQKGETITALHSQTFSPATKRPAVPVKESLWMVLLF